MRKWKNFIFVLFLFIFVISSVFSVAETTENTPIISGNKVTVITSSEDGNYKIKTTIENIKDSNGSGKFVCSAELMAAAVPPENLFITVNQEESKTNSFRFNSKTNGSDNGLFPTARGWTSSDDLQKMVTLGCVNRIDIYVAKTTCKFSTGSIYDGVGV